MSPRKLSLVTLAATLALITVGGYTRGSGSGFGCADRWPLCEGGLLGGWLPRADYNMIVEWGHRWLAAVVGVLAVATAIAAWRRSPRRVGLVATAAVGVIAVQAWVGRLIVARDLDADLVTLHLFLSMTIAGLLTGVVVATATRADAPGDRGWTLGVGVVAGAAFLLIMAGSYAHDLYVSGWPLVGDRLLPPLADPRLAVHFAHRVLAGIVLAAVAVLVVVARRRARPAGDRRLLHLVLVVHAVNIGIGAAHVFTRVGSPVLVAGHLLAAALVWVGLVAVTVRAAGDVARSRGRVGAGRR